MKGAQASLVLTAVELSGSTYRFRWNAEAGRRYRLQYKAGLGDAEWKDMASDLVATDDSWIPDSFKEGMADIAAGRVVELDTVLNEPCSDCP